MRDRQTGHAFPLILAIAIVAISAVAYFYPGPIAARPTGADEIRLTNPVHATLRTGEALRP